MDLKEIKELIALMRKNDLSVFKMEKEGFKITLKKGTDFQPVISTPASTPPLANGAGTTPAAANGPTASSQTSGEPVREITSPMVGTFYAAPAQDAAPYVSVGQEVSEETVVCIIEAMKVMNEIKAEARGIIAEVVVESGNPVQFGQALFRLK